MAQASMRNPGISPGWAAQLLVPILCFALALPGTATADVVKPALIEVSAHKGGKITIEIRASLEAMITGISTQYKNTQDAPQAAEYDALRVLESAALRAEFEQFLPTLLASLSLHDNAHTYPLKLEEAHIPPAGYTQVPRISTLNLIGALPPSAQSVQLEYPEIYGDHAIRVRQIDSAADKWHWSEWQWVRMDTPRPSFSLTEIYTQRTPWQTFREFAEIGFLHIVPKGLDHILFVLGLFLFSRAWQPLLMQVTMFTAAHTLTLALATLGWVSMPDRLVEPLIALSIAYVGIENLWLRQLGRHRLVLVFAFGLLHGLGFAGVLTDFDMPDDAFVWSLVSFNIGVELGQIAVLVLAALAVGWLRPEARYRRWIATPASITIAITGLIWAIQRLQG